MNAVVSRMPSRAISSYIRVSMAYAVRNVLIAHRTAMYRPARRPNRLHPAHIPAGMHSNPNVSDRACVADSLVPNTLIHTCKSR